MTEDYLLHIADEAHAFLEAACTNTFYQWTVPFTGITIGYTLYETEGHWFGMRMIELRIWWRTP